MTVRYEDGGAGVATIALHPPETADARSGALGDPLSAPREDGPTSRSDR